MQQSNHNSYIDSLKGAAILAVTMIHTGGSHLPGILGQIGEAGARGVQLFLLISGMLAFVSLHHAFPERSAMRAHSVLRWLRGKWIRLFPIYYLGILIVMVSGTWSTYWLGTEDHVTIWNILMHLVFLHGLVPHYTNSVFGVEWYLGVYVLFMLVVPLLYRYVDSLGKSALLVLVVHIAAPRANDYLTRLLPMADDPTVYDTYAHNFGLLCQLPVLCMGILLYYVIRSLRSIEMFNRKILAYTLLALSLYMLYGQIQEANSLYNTSTYEMYALWFGMMIVSQVIHTCPVIDNPLFRACGRHSYGMFLFQFIWLSAYSRYLSPHVGDGWVVKFSISVVALLSISIVLERFIDQPIERKMIALLR